MNRQEFSNILKAIQKKGKRVFAKFTDSSKSDIGELFLNYAQEFSIKIGWKSEAFDRSLKAKIKAGDNQSIKSNADLLDAFFPNYEQDLYHYYSLQQYDMLFRFLQYPFLDPSLESYIMPYKKGLAFLEGAQCLDYGSGIPYGLIACLLTQPQTIKSITLIDLDLIHVDFVEFVIKKIVPDIDLEIYRLRDTEIFPDLKGSYNFFFGKDIFEHLHKPENKLQKLMSYSAGKSICYFDLKNRGAIIYQHLTPRLDYLVQEMEKLGFCITGRVGDLLEFKRNTFR